MLIWMFSASLLHLSYAARNELRVKVILRFILIGLTINLIIAVPLMIPSVSLFGTIACGLKDQISFFFVLNTEARPGGGLWGLSPPKFVKVSPSITEDEYIY